MKNSKQFYSFQKYTHKSFISLDYIFKSSPSDFFQLDRKFLRMQKILQSALQLRSRQQTRFFDEKKYQNWIYDNTTFCASKREKIYYQLRVVCIHYKAYHQNSCSKPPNQLYKLTIKSFHHELQSPFKCKFKTFQVVSIIYAAKECCYFRAQTHRRSVHTPAIWIVMTFKCMQTWHHLNFKRTPHHCYTRKNIFNAGCDNGPSAWVFRAN